MTLPPCPDCGQHAACPRNEPAGGVLSPCPHPCHALAQEVLEAVNDRTGRATCPCCQVWGRCKPSCALDRLRASLQEGGETA